MVTELNPILCLILFSGYHVISAQDDHLSYSKQNVPCITKSCVISASKLIEKADFSANPCHDFYHYSCGKFLERTAASEDIPIISQHTAMSEISHAMVKYIFDEPRKMSEPEAFWKAKDFFHSCMNHKYDEQQLKDMFERSGGWPVWEGTYWRQANFDWQGLLARLNPDGVVLIVQEKAPENITSDSSIPPQTFHLVVNPLMYGEMLRDGFDTPWIVKYENFMVHIPTTLDAVKPEKEMRDVLELMVTLAEAAPYPELSENQLMTIKELKENITKMDWLRFFNEIFQEKIEEDFQIVVHNPDYVKFVIDKLSTTPKRTVANFIIWELIQKVIPMLDMSIPATFEEFDWQEKNTIKKVVKCIEETLNSFSDVAFSMYVRKYLQEEDKIAVQKLYKYVSKELSRYFAEEGLNKAKEKIHSLKVHAGYPEDIHEDKVLSSAYGCLSINQWDHISNLWNLAKFSGEKMIRKQSPFAFNDPWDPAWISGSPYMIYKPGISHFIIPPTLLQCAIFDSERPQSLNFATLGQEIAKTLLSELTKSSSDESRNIKKLKLFHSLGKSKNVTGDQQEVTALNIAYKAFQDWNAVHKDEKFLPTVPLTSNQLFWLAYGNKKCAVTYEEKNMRQIETNRRNELQGILQAIPDFMKDFNCS